VKKSVSMLFLLLCFGLSSSMLSVAFASSDNWVEVTRFSDEIWFMPEYTDSFQINCSEWRIRWEVESLSYGSDLSFWVVPQENYNPKRFSDSLSIAGVNQFTKTDGTLNITSEPGTYYLFTGTSGSRYTLIVEQNLESIPEFPSWLVLPLFLVVSLAAIIYRTGLHRKPN